MVVPGDEVPAGDVATTSPHRSPRRAAGHRRILYIEEENY